MGQEIPYDEIGNVRRRLVHGLSSCLRPWRRRTGRPTTPSRLRRITRSAPRGWARARTWAACRASPTPLTMPSRSSAPDTSKCRMITGATGRWQIGWVCTTEVPGRQEDQRGRHGGIGNSPQARSASRGRQPRRELIRRRPAATEALANDDNARRDHRALGGDRLRCRSRTTDRAAADGNAGSPITARGRGWCRQDGGGKSPRPTAWQRPNPATMLRGARSIDGTLRVELSTSAAGDPRA